MYGRNYQTEEIERFEALITALRTGAIGPKPIIPAGSEIAVSFKFTPLTPTTTIFGAVFAGTTFNAASVLVETSFDDPSATLMLGTSANSSLLLAAADSKLSRAGSYMAEPIVVIDTGDVLSLHLALGASTVGEGYVFFRYLPP